MLTYVGVFDGASGERKGDDEAALGIGHAQAPHVVLDLIRSWRPPFNPNTAIAEAAALLKRYRITVVHGDRWAPGFTADAFRTHDIRYEPLPVDKSALYLELLHLVNSGTAVMLDDDGLVKQLRQLERRRGPQGHDRIDHPRGRAYHDDRANVCAGALYQAAQRLRPMSVPLAVIRVDNTVRNRYRDPGFAFTAELSARRMRHSIASALASRPRPAIRDRRRTPCSTACDAARRRQRSNSPLTKGVSPTRRSADWIAQRRRRVA